MPDVKEGCNPLTSRQSEIYNFLESEITQKGLPPTVREIGSQFGIRSPNGVMCHLKALEKKGLITRDEHLSRAIALVHNPNDMLKARCRELIKLYDGQSLGVEFDNVIEEIDVLVNGE